MTVVWTFVAGLVFGLVLAAPPGPMNAIIAEESVLRGWLSGFKAGLGAMTADFVFFVLALVGVVAVVEQVALLRHAMVAVGGVLMLYFAYQAALGAQQSFRSAADIPESRGFLKAFLLALTNPYQVLFWLTVGVGLLVPGRIDMLAYGADRFAGLVVVETGHPVLLVGFFGGIFIWIVGFPAALTAAGRQTDDLAPLVAAISALVLGVFGMYFLYDAAAGLWL